MASNSNTTLSSGSPEWRSRRPSSNANTYTPSFSHLYGNPAFEDTQVIIQEEQLHADPHKQQEPAASTTMPASKAVLYTMSEFVRNKVRTHTPVCHGHQPVA
jgi:hypothetical protein